MIGDQRSVGVSGTEGGRDGGTERGREIWTRILFVPLSLRLSVSLSLCHSVPLSVNLGRRERGERDELQSALGSDEQAFASQFCGYGRKQHPAQLPSLDLEFGVRLGGQFAATRPADLISRSQQLIDALRRHFDLNALWQEMAFDAVRGHQPEKAAVGLGVSGGSERVFEQDRIFVEQPLLNFIHTQRPRMAYFRIARARASEQVEQIARPGAFADIQRISDMAGARLTLIEAHQQVGVNFVGFLRLCEEVDAKSMIGFFYQRRVCAFSPERFEDLYSALDLVYRFPQLACASRQHRQAEARAGLAITVLVSQAEFEHFLKLIPGARIVFLPDIYIAQIPKRFDLTANVFEFTQCLKRPFQHRARFIIPFQPKVGFPQAYARAGGACRVFRLLPQAQRLFETLQRQLILIASDAHRSDAVMHLPLADSIHNPLSRLQRLLEAFQRPIQGAEIIVAPPQYPLPNGYSDVVLRAQQQFERAPQNGDRRLVGAQRAMTKPGSVKRDSLFIRVADLPPERARQFIFLGRLAQRFGDVFPPQLLGIVGQLFSRNTFFVRLNCVTRIFQGDPISSANRGARSRLDLQMVDARTRRDQRGSLRAVPAI